ncbi:V-type ATPase subunit, partial [Acidobacteriota bacterium]
MKKLSSLDYAYAVGRVRALENHLVPKAVFWAAAEEKDVRSALKVIFDVGSFSDEHINMENSKDLDNFVDGENENLVQSVSGLLLDEDLKGVLFHEGSLSEAFAAAKESGNSFMTDYLRHKIDLGNLKVFLRSKYSGLSKKTCLRWLHQGGSVDVSRYVDNYELSLTECSGIHKITPFHQLWCDAVDALEDRETFADLERGIDDFLMRFLRRAKSIVFGPEPIFAYALARQKEIHLVRLVCIGKINHLPYEVLQARISETYV